MSHQGERKLSPPFFPIVVHRVETPPKKKLYVAAQSAGLDWVDDDAFATRPSGGKCRSRCPSPGAAERARRPDQKLLPTRRGGDSFRRWRSGQARHLLSRKEGSGNGGRACAPRGACAALFVLVWWPISLTLPRRITAGEGGTHINSPPPRPAAGLWAPRTFCRGKGTRRSAPWAKFVGHMMH